MKNTIANTINNNVLGGLKMTNVLRKINTKEQFRAVLDGMMKKEQINIPSITIDLVKGKFNTFFESSATPLSRAYTKEEVIDSVLIRDGSRIKTIVDKFSFGYLSVAVTTESKIFAEDLFGGTIYLVHASNGWVKLFADLRSNGRYTDLETNKDVSKLPAGEVYRFKGLSWTASNKRQFTMVFRNVTKSDDRFMRLDHATLGGMTKIRDSYGLDESKFMDLQKAGGYVGNVMTGSVNFGIVPGYVRYYAKWENDTNETFLTEAYDKARKSYMAALRSSNIEDIRATKAVLDEIIKSKKKLKNINTQDGQMYVNARVFAELVKAKYNIEIDQKALTGLMIQLRPGTIKASAIIVSEEVFNAFVEGTVAMANARGQKIDFVGDRDNLLYIADKNAIKLDYDMTRSITMEVLAFAKCSSGKTSKQLAETVLYAANELGEDGAQLLYDILKLSVDKKAASLTVDKKARLLTPEEIESGAKGGYINDIVVSIAPKFIEQNKAFFNSVWRQAINSVTNMIDGLSGDIKSHNRRLASDPVFILTGGKIQSVLNTGEVFINNRKVSKVVMIKYPKMGLREFYFANNVSLKDIIKRANYFVKNNMITKAEAELIIKFYRELDSFVAVLPAKSVIAYACAGLDFDYDGALFIEHTANPAEEVEVLTNKMVDLLERTKMKAVVIQN